MSFNSEIKNELARIKPSRRDCRLAELSAIIHLDGSFHIHGSENFSFNTFSENASVARKTFALLQELFSIGTEIRVWDKRRLAKGKRYEINVSPQEGITQVLNELGILDDSMRFDYGIAPRIVKRSCCAIAYLRGAFLAAGAVNDPKKGYHFEIVTTSEKYSQEICRLLERFALKPRVTARKSNFAVYLKESESIVQFLALVGAYQMLFKWIDAKILHEVRNEINRLINCDTANLKRTIEAAQEQISDIRLIEEVLDLNTLTPALKQIADLRIGYPEMNIRELGEMADPKLSKSAVNHRLRRVRQLAEAIRQGK